MGTKTFPMIIFKVYSVRGATIIVDSNQAHAKMASVRQMHLALQESVVVHFPWKTNLCPDVRNYGANIRDSTQMWKKYRKIGV
jgi:hypothetical protein